MRKLLLPLFESRGCICVETEADNFYVVFPDAVEALAAALEIYPVLDAYNESKNDPDYHIVIGGIGLGFGADIIQVRAILGTMPGLCLSVRRCDRTSTRASSTVNQCWRPLGWARIWARSVRF